MCFVRTACETPTYFSLVLYAEYSTREKHYCCYLRDTKIRLHTCTMTVKVFYC